MIASLPPLPAPAEFPASPPARPGLFVGNLPLSGVVASESPRRAPLPRLDHLSRATVAEAPPGPKTTPMPNPPPDYTDEDLREAIAPLVAGAMAGESLRDDASLEAMLRSTFRRALAEHHGGLFQPPGWNHRALWHLQALFTSRSYEEVLADKIRRFHVEEVHLLDRDKLSLISYASSDPARHAHPRKVGPFSRQLALRVRIDADTLQSSFELGEGRRALARSGRFSLLVAVVRGDVNDLVKADLDFALRRIESRYESELVRGTPLLHELQPLLEECLLIHSPAPPAAS